jgi:hypothetical protein
MGRIIVEYNPPLSNVVQKIIRNEVTPSMVSNDETSCQYEISIVSNCLEEVIQQKLQEVDVTEDLKLINQLIEEGVDFLEF